jgi:hypothetical protein
MNPIVVKQSVVKALQLHICEWPKVALAFCLLLCSALAGMAGDDQNAPMLTTNSPFVLYLQNPPWIKKMQFKKSQVLKKVTGGRNGAKNVIIETFEGAIQPSGFYFERRQPSIPGVTRPHEGIPWPHDPDERGMGGICNDYYWAAYWQGVSPGAVRNLSLDPRHPEEGASDKNTVRDVMGLYLIDLENIRFWGLPELRPNSFELKGDNQFMAVTAKGDLLNGKILTVSDNKPLELTYSLNTGSASAVIKYQYGPNQPLPNYFEISRTMNGRPVVAPQTNWIDRMEYGLAGEIQSGYAPSLFFDLSKFTHTILWSNGVDYTLGSDGSMIANNHVQRPPVLGDMKTERHELARWVMISIIFVSAMAAWATMRRANKQTNTTPTE